MYLLNMWCLCIYQICGINVFIKYVVFMYLSNIWYLYIYQICGIYEIESNDVTLSKKLTECGYFEFYPE